jgi:16S rRNA (guanine527-N7)-methyltransferase
MTDGSPEPLTAAQFQLETGIGDCDRGRLETYLGLLEEWRPRVNLVAHSTFTDPWRRHVLDSAQLMPLLPDGLGRIADLGSGAGFPGMVLAMLGASDVHLIESEGRKCAFLETVSRETNCPVTIHNNRAETLPGLAADVVTARALAPCKRLLPLVARHLNADGTALLLKGRKAEEELTECSKNWMMSLTRIQSRSDPSGTILNVRDLTFKYQKKSTRNQ